MYLQPPTTSGLRNYDVYDVILTPQTGNGGIYMRVVFAKSHLVVFFVALSLGITWLSETSDGNILFRPIVYANNIGSCTTQYNL